MLVLLALVVAAGACDWDEPAGGEPAGGLTGPAPTGQAPTGVGAPADSVRARSVRGSSASPRTTTPPVPTLAPVNRKSPAPRLVSSRVTSWDTLYDTKITKWYDETYTYTKVDKFFFTTTRRVDVYSDGRRRSSQWRSGTHDTWQITSVPLIDFDHVTSASIVPARTSSLPPANPAPGG